MMSHPFTAHMTGHMALVAVVAPALAILVGPSRWNPATRWPTLFSAIAGSMIELAVVWLWHTPVLHLLAREGWLMFAAEQASFFTAGMYLWISALTGESLQRRMSGVIGLLLTAIHMTLLGALIALAPRVLYSHHASTDALVDQQVGGVAMLLVGGTAYLVGGVVLAWKLLRSSLRQQERGDLASFGLLETRLGHKVARVDSLRI